MPIRQLLSEAQWKEAFEWVPNIERIKAFNKTNPNTKIYAIEALHEMVTDPNNIGHGPRKYSTDELIRSARTLIGGFFNWNHEDKLKEGPNDIIDAEWSDKSGVIEAIGAISDKEAQEAITSGRVKHVSIQAPPPREIEVLADGTQVPRGLIFEGLALITEGEMPGDPKSSIRLIETLKVKDSSLNSQTRQTNPVMETVANREKLRAVTLPSVIKALDESNLSSELKYGIAAMARHAFGEVEHPGECPPGQHMGTEGTCVVNEQAECPVGQEMGPDGKCVPSAPTAEKVKRVLQEFAKIREGMTDDLLKKLSIEFKDKKVGLDPTLLASLSGYPQVATQVGAMEKQVAEMKEALKPENIILALRTQKENEPTLELKTKSGRSIRMPGSRRGI